MSNIDCAAETEGTSVKSDASSAAGSLLPGSSCRKKCHAAATRSLRRSHVAATTLLPVPAPPMSQKSLAAPGSRSQASTRSKIHSRVPGSSWPAFSFRKALKSRRYAWCCASLPTAPPI